MEGKRVVVDVEQIDLLEQRVLKATELIRALRRERDAAQTKLQQTREALDRLQAEHKSMAGSRQESHDLTHQIEVMREERLAIRGKVTRMLEMMAGLEEPPAQAHGDH